MFSAFHTELNTKLSLLCSRVQHTNAKGHETQIPEVIKHYNKFMGGVDKGDQMILLYDPDLRSVKLWRKILLNILLTASGMKCFHITNFGHTTIFG